MWKLKPLSEFKKKGLNNIDVIVPMYSIDVIDCKLLLGVHIKANSQNERWRDLNDKNDKVLYIKVVIKNSC